MVKMNPTLLKIFCMISLLSYASASLSTEGMLQLAHKSRRNVIEVNDLNFEELLGGERDFHLVLLLSTTSPQIQCLLCNELQPEYEIVSSSWLADHPNGLSEAEFEESEEIEKSKKNMFFASSDYFNSKNLYSKFQLNNIPRIFIFPPTKDSSPQNFLREFDDYQFYAGSHSELLKNYLSSKTGHHMNLYVPINYGRIFSHTLTTFIVSILAFKYWDNVSKMLTSKVIWGTASLIGVVFLISGYMFNKIRGVPYLRDHGNGVVNYFTAGQQSQFGIETQILAFIYGTLGVLTVILSKNTQKIKNSQLNFIAVTILSFLVFLFYSILLIVFGIKGIGYPYKLISLG